MRKMVRPLAWGVFVIYCIGLIHVLFITRPVRPSLSYADYFREYTNFVPFKTVIDFVHGFLIDVGLKAGSDALPREWPYYVINLAGNFVLFLPMGIALPCLFKRLRRSCRACLIILGVVILAELTQGLLRVGSIDVDDVIFNVCGGMLGYGAYKLLSHRDVWSKIGVIQR